MSADLGPFLTPADVSPEAEDLHLRLMAGDGLPLTSEPAQCSAARSLLDAGLAQVRSGRLVGVPVRLAVEQWASEQEGRVRAARFAAQHYAAQQRTSSGGFIEVLRGMEQAEQAFTQVQHAARETVLCFDRAPYFAANRGTVSPAQEEVASSGVQYRVVYHPDVLADPVTAAGVRTSIAMGEEARAFHGVPVRMLLADTSMAVLLLPYGTDPVTGGPADIDAVLVHPSALLDALVRIFALVWDLAVPVGDLPGDGAAGSSGGGDDEARRILSMLALGLTDSAIARQLGVSERTVHRRVTRLQERLGAPNRFSLGVRAAREGWI